MRIARHPGALWRRTFDRTVVLPPGSDEPLHLAGTAEQIWLLLEAPESVEGLTRVLAAVFGTVPASIEDDVATFVETSIRHGAMQIRG